MAEVLLNAVWLVVSVGMLASSRARLRSTVGMTQAIVVMACIAVLLFPVVSATDDLCVLQFAAEDGTVLKKVSQHSSPVASPNSWFFAIPGAAHLSVTPWHTENIIDGLEFVAASSLVAPAHQDRAPPLS